MAYPSKKEADRANEWFQYNVNAMFEKYGVPVRIAPQPAGAVRTMWELKYQDGCTELDKVMEKMYAVQDSILRKPQFADVTKDDALFMAMSQWFEWVMCGGKMSMPDTPAMMAVVGNWINIWKAKGGNAS